MIEVAMQNIVIDIDNVEKNIQMLALKERDQLEGIKKC